MTIVEILENKTNEIVNGGDKVCLTAEELNIICDVDQQRAFKIYLNLPRDFKSSRNLDECIKAIRNGDSLYRTLEYCIITNKALCSVREIFGIKEM